MAKRQSRAPQTPNKPYLLFSMQRTGSSPVYELLSHVFEHQFGVEPLYEFYDPWGNTIEDSNDGVVQRFEAGPRASLGMAQLYGEITRRHRIIKRYTGRYFFKVMVDQLTGETLRWLSEHYEWIFLERRDLVELVLSNLVSRATGLFYDSRLKALETGSLLAKRSDFERTLESWEFLITLKNNIPHRYSLYYEDYVSKSPERFLSDAGFGTFAPEIWNGRLNFQPVNREDKLALFKNRLEICDWFEAANIPVGESSGDWAKNAVRDFRGNVIDGIVP